MKVNGADAEPGWAASGVRSIQDALADIKDQTKASRPWWETVLPWLTFALALTTGLVIPYFLARAERRRAVFAIWENFTARHAQLAAASLDLRKDQVLNRPQYLRAQGEFLYLLGLAQSAAHENLVDLGMLKALGVTAAMKKIVDDVQHQIDVCTRIIGDPAATQGDKDTASAQRKVWRDWMKEAAEMGELVRRAEAGQKPRSWFSLRS